MKCIRRFQWSNRHQKHRIDEAWLCSAPLYHRNHPVVWRKPSKPVSAGTRRLGFHSWLKEVWCFLLLMWLRVTAFGDVVQYCCVFVSEGSSAHDCMKAMVRLYWGHIWSKSPWARAETCPSDSRARDASGTFALTTLAGGTDRFGQISWSHVAGWGEICCFKLILFDSGKYTLITFLHLEFHLTLIFEPNHILLN